LLQLINEVLDIARIEAGKVAIFPEPVAVEALLRSPAPGSDRTLD
jgi:signal transduction histidine kinase